MRLDRRAAAALAENGAFCRYEDDLLAVLLSTCHTERHTPKSNINVSKTKKNEREGETREEVSGSTKYLRQKQQRKSERRYIL
jgi:hypothetical protein